MPKVLYIAGPMTGLPDLNYPAFNKAEQELQEAGFDTRNPVDNIPNKINPSWLDFMRMSLVQISQANGIATLPNWMSSKGARIEVDLAESLGLEVMSVHHWLSKGNTDA